MKKKEIDLALMIVETLERPMVALAFILIVFTLVLTAIAIVATAFR